MAALQFERDYGFPCVIVWDALVDEDLVSGWLAEADIEPKLGGRYHLRWVHCPGMPETDGHIVLMAPPEFLEVSARNVHLRFGLEEIPGGSRGTSTRLHVRVEINLESAFLSRVKADWLTNLDQLDDLLFGHPMNWATWDRDMLETWSQHLDEVENSTA